MRLLADGAENWTGDHFADSMQMQQEAAQVGFDWPTPIDVVKKLREELDELEAAIHAGSATEIDHELGDMLLALVNIARMLHLDPHRAMHNANTRFRGRFIKMRSLIESQGRSMNECTLDQLDRAWNEIKREDRSQ